MRRITFCLSYPCRFTSHLSDPKRGPDPPAGARGPTVNFFNDHGGRYRISDITSQGGAIDIFMLMVSAPRSASAPTRGATIDIF
jgi:hypothetical protein